MVGGHHRFDGHEFEQAPGNGEGQGGLCAAVHGVRRDQVTEQQYEGNDFHEPRLLHLPIHRKALNSVTWNV